MLAIIQSAGIVGIDATPIRVEVDISDGLPMWTTVGLAESAVRESKDRVISAIKNSGYEFQRRRITINLSPADIKKEGTAYDLPMALGLLAASELLAPSALQGFIMLGEVSLDGSLCPIRGALPAAIMAAATQNIRGLILPAANAAEAAVVSGLPVYGIGHLSEAVDFLRGERTLQSHPIVSPISRNHSSENNRLDLADVRGQPAAKRALEIAAAGGHNLLLIGPPGTGKTMLAQRMPTILPSLEFDEMIETTKIYSAVGLVARQAPLVVDPPFRSPHHTISTAGLIGGGTSPRPGEITLAHNGVLFLDELPEFHRDALEALREPLETGTVSITRARSRLVYPSRFRLIAAMNPCPCGYHGSNFKTCLCPTTAIRRYRNKLSGPLLDRIDLHLEIPQVRFHDLANDRPEECSRAVQERVVAARARQLARYQGLGTRTNADLSGRLIRKYCRLDAKTSAYLGKIVESFHLSARAHDKTLKLARTIADLAGCDEISISHLSETMQYRSTINSHSL